MEYSMARTKFKFTVGMVAMLVAAIGLAGCGSDDNSSANEASAQPSESQAATVTPQPEAESEAVRKVTDEFGEIEIPVKPQRVAGIYLEDYLTALGVEPIVQWYHPSWGKQEYLGLDLPQFDITGSMEALVAADPDLIIVDGGADAAKYEQYSKVAPTYRIPEQYLGDSTEVLKQVADVLGIPEKADTALSEYNQKISDAKAKFQSTIGKETVAVVRLNIGDKTLALFGTKNRFTGFIYNELGLTPHPMTVMEDFQQVLSEEAIPELNADHIIIFPSNGAWDSKENEEAVKLLDSPLWKSLPAVKNNHVYSYDRSHWQSGAIIANEMKIDDLLKSLAP
jgi:ABC-type Fe3+-hydroxamate transport system substrate-binding protein